MDDNTIDGELKLTWFIGDLDLRGLIRPLHVSLDVGNAKPEKLPLRDHQGPVQVLFHLLVEPVKEYLSEFKFGRGWEAFETT